MALEGIQIQSVAVDVAHDEDITILRWKVRRVDIRDAAVRSELVLMLNNRFDLPSVRWIGATLAMVVAGLGQVPQVIDDASADGFAEMLPICPSSHAACAVLRI